MHQLQDHIQRPSQCSAERALTRASTAKRGKCLLCLCSALL
uniref:Uncharacterized protein n=1 Tax=Anguilla anguilla TaxID=7936 RepID=A0A0E9S3I7_ANGAN